MKLITVVLGIALVVFQEWDLFGLIGYHLTRHPVHVSVMVGILTTFAGVLWWKSLYQPGEDQATPFQLFLVLLVTSTITYAGVRLMYSHNRTNNPDVELLAIVTMASHASLIFPLVFMVLKRPIRV